MESIVGILPHDEDLYSKGNVSGKEIAQNTCCVVRGITCFHEELTGSC